MGAWMLYVVLAATLVALAARGLEELMALVRVPTRFVWLAAMLVAAVLAATSPFRGPVAIAAGAAGAVQSASEGAAASVPVASAAAVAASGGAGVERLLAAVRGAVQWPLRAALPLTSDADGVALAAVWLTLSLMLLVVGGATLLRYRSLRRRWPTSTIDGVAVRIASATGPAVLGVLRPEIVVPRWLLTAEPQARRMVLLHEREHVRARDPLALAAGCVAVALMPWNPALWWMLARLRAAVELDCDLRVLRSGVRPRAYGSLLVEIAGRRSGLPLGAAALTGAGSLERRLLAMTTRVSHLRAARACGFAVVGACALIAACDARVPTAAEIEAMDAASVEAHPLMMRFVTPAAEVERYLDGVRIGSDEARSLGADRIRQIEVIRARDGDVARIHFRTVAAERPVESGTFEVRIADGNDGDSQRRVLVRSRTTEGREPALSADRLTLAPVAASEALVLIDGRIADGAQLRVLHPDRIDRVEVIKGETAARQFDDARAVHGVIRITTKPAPR